MGNPQNKLANTKNLTGVTALALTIPKSTHMRACADAYAYARAGSRIYLFRYISVYMGLLIMH